MATPNEDTMVYVCGPAGFNKWVKDSAIALGWNKDYIKEEVFSADTNILLEPKAFELV